jgi:hypothetical protein
MYMWSTEHHTLYYMGESLEEKFLSFNQKPVFTILNVAHRSGNLDDS